MEHQLATKPVQKEQTNNVPSSSSLLQASPDRVSPHILYCGYSGLLVIKPCKP